MSFTPSELGLTYPGGYIVTEVFEGTGIGIVAPDYVLDVSVNPNGVQLLRFELNTAKRPFDKKVEKKGDKFAVRDMGKTGIRTEL